MLRLFLILITLQLGLVGVSWADGQLGLDRDGKLAFTLLQYQEPYSQNNRQSILWPNAKTLERKGQLHTVHWNHERLLLAYSKTVFEALPAQDLRLLQKAPLGYIYICLGDYASAGETPVALLRNSKSGRYFRWAGQGSEPVVIPILDGYQKANTMSPWASTQFPALWIPQQDEQSNNTLCILSSDLAQCQFFSDETIKDFNLLSFAESSEGLWLLPQQGIDGLFWNGHQLTPQQLPKPELADAQWLHLAEHGGSFSHGLLKTKDGIQLKDKTGLHLIGGEEQAERENYERPLWQQSLIFLVMISSFLVILRWRETAGVQLSKKPIVHEPAPIFIRVLAFFFDCYLLSFPTHIISNLLDLPQAPPEIVTALFTSTSMTAFVQNYVQLNQIVIGTLILFIILMITYQTVMDVYFSGSIGKLFFRLSVISTKETKDTKVTFKQALLKSVFRSLDYILPIPPNLIFAIINKDNISLADRIAKVQVVRRK